MNPTCSPHHPAAPLTAVPFTPFTLAIALAFGIFGACAVDEESEEPWIGEERGALEQVPDETPSFIDEEELQDVFGDDQFTDITSAPDPQYDTWTAWYDRDNPSGDGDWELRYLQAGVCNAPTGVECRTVSGLALWQTGEVVSCSAADGLLCLNANQPDGVCNYDYKVRFLCPNAPPPCGNGICEAGQSYASCPQDCPPPCGNGICEAGQSYASCPQDCHCGNGICDIGENSTICGQDCNCIGLGYQGMCSGGSRVCCDSQADCLGGSCQSL